MTNISLMKGKQVLIHICLFSYLLLPLLVKKDNETKYYMLTSFMEISI